VRDKINLRRAIPLAIADGFPDRVIGKLLNGRPCATDNSHFARGSPPL